MDIVNLVRQAKGIIDVSGKKGIHRNELRRQLGLSDDKSGHDTFSKVRRQVLADRAEYRDRGEYLYKVKS